MVLVPVCVWNWRSFSLRSVDVVWLDILGGEKHLFAIVVKGECEVSGFGWHAFSPIVLDVPKIASFGSSGAGIVEPILANLETSSCFSKFSIFIILFIRVRLPEFSSFNMAAFIMNWNGCGRVAEILKVWVTLNMLGRSFLLKVRT